MNPQPEQDVELRLKQLETELNSPATSPTAISQPQTPQQIQTDNSPNEQSQLGHFFNWFNNLPGLGRLLIIGVAAIVGIAILRAVLKLVAAVISLTVLAVLLYLAYQFFLGRSAETKD
jgi:hypothetical protein